MQRPRGPDLAAHGGGGARGGPGRRSIDGAQGRRGGFREGRSRLSEGREARLERGRGGGGRHGSGLAEGRGREGGRGRGRGWERRGCHGELRDPGEKKEEREESGGGERAQRISGERASGVHHMGRSSTVSW